MASEGPFFTKEHKEALAASNARPIAPQAFGSNGLVFVTGQTPSTLAGQPVEGSFTEKVIQCCENIKTILAQVGSDISQTCKVTVFVDNLGNVPELNEVYKKYFPHLPARSCVEVAKLARGVPVEIECIAKA